VTASDDINPSGATGPRAGRILADRYQLLRRIAVGGMAEVWEANDEVLGRAVAVKILHAQFAADQTIRTRFHNEAVAAARLIDPSIVAIYDTVDIDGCDAIVMEFVRGRTLREFLDERGSLEPIEVVHIGAEVAGALAVAHRAGVIHRDIKPANILLSDDGRVLVTDFGIAKILDEPDLTRTAQLLGTVKYLAPEQVEGGPVDGRTDLYALGAVLYEALCGEAPFRAETPAALALARMHRDPTRPSLVIDEVPVDLDTALMRALSRRPAGRFASAPDMRAALLATRLDVAADHTITAAPIIEPGAPTPAVPAMTRRRNRSGIAVTIVIVAVLVLVALLIANTEAGRRLLSDAPATTTTPASARAIAVTSAHSFDPSDHNGGLENEADAQNAIDGNDATAWRTESYSTHAFGNLKDGVGLTITLARTESIRSISITSPSTGWAVAVYVAETPRTTLASWGSPVATATAIHGQVLLDLHGATGDSVLVWITDLGNGPPWEVALTDIVLTS
jgi:serine/threonine protein kinase